MYGFCDYFITLGNGSGFEHYVQVDLPKKRIRFSHTKSLFFFFFTLFRYSPPWP